MYKNILVPIDGSWASRLGLIEAIRLAHGQGANVRLLHVVDEFIIDPTSSVPSYYGEYVKALREAGRATLADETAFAKEHGVAAQSVLIDTVGRRAADVIIEQTKQWPADIIVMGTHGRRGIKRLVMGSDAELVVRTAPVPVMLVRERERDAK